MDSASSMEVTMSEENNYLVQQPFKRRRFHTAIEHAESGQLNPFNHSPAFAAFGSQSARTPFATVNGFKRSRADGSFGNELNRVAQDQSEEVESLKTEKTTLEATVTGLRSENEKVLHENKILKKAVTIQQERHYHAASELDAARRYKVDADEKIRMLEQMVMTLRYHLQAQQIGPGNDFMNNSHRPPDVYWVQEEIFRTSQDPNCAFIEI